MPMLHRWFLSSLVLLGAGCGEVLTPTGGPVEARYTAATQPGAGLNAQGFYWLPPMVPNPGPFTGQFDADRELTVRVVCTGASGAACPLVVQLDGSGSGAARLKADVEEEAYVANWYTPASLQLGPDRYRLEVVEAGQVIGQADLWVVNRQPDLKGMPVGYLGLVRGRPFLIKFRVEEGANPPPPPPVIARMDGSGGLVEIPLGGGSALLVEIPTGALAEPVDFTFTPRTPGPGRFVSVGIAPGKQFFAKPVVLTMTLGAPLAPADAALLALTLGPVGAPGTIILRTNQAAGDEQQFVATTHLFGPSGPLSESGGAPMALAAGPGSPATREAATEEGTIEAFVATVEDRINALRAAAAELEALLQYEQAIRYRLAAAALLETVGDPDGAAAAELDAAQQTACSVLDLHFYGAGEKLGEQFGNLRTAIRPVLAYTAAVRSLGTGRTECAADAKLDAVLTDLVVQFIELYTAAMTRASFPGNAPALADELYQALFVRQYGPVLGLEGVFGRLKADVQIPIAELYHAAAYAFCRTDGDHSYLGKLFRVARDGEMYPPLLPPLARLRQVVGEDDLPFGADDLSRGLHLCGTAISVTSKTSDGFGTQVGPLGGGAGPFEYVLTETVPARYQGSLALDGLLLAQQCEDGSYGNDVIALDFNGARIRLLPRIEPTGSFIRLEPVVVTMEELLSEGGVPPGEGGTFPLSVVRLSDGCGGAYRFPDEPGERELVTVSVVVPSVAILPGSATLAPGEAASFTASVTGSDNGVTWEVTGGTGIEEGEALAYTAGVATGSFTVIARSVDAPDRFATASITIEGECVLPASQPAGTGPASMVASQAAASCVVVQVSPGSTNLVYGATRQFVATVTGAANTGVIWTATGGTITASGLYTAGVVAGTFAVTATSIADPEQSAVAVVTIVAPTPQPPPSLDFQIISGSSGGKPVSPIRYRVRVTSLPGVTVEWTASAVGNGTGFFPAGPIDPSLWTFASSPPQQTSEHVVDWFADLTYGSGILIPGVTTGVTISVRVCYFQANGQPVRNSAGDPICRVLGSDF